jgi:hypothetical protein
VVTAFLNRRDAIEATLQKMGKPGSVQAEPEAA